MERFSGSAKLRYAANDTKDILFRSKSGLLDLELSDPEEPRKKDKTGMEIERVTIGPFQNKGFIAEITWVRNEPHTSGVIEHAHYGSAAVFDIAEEAERYLNEYLELGRYESRIVA